MASRQFPTDHRPALHIFPINMDAMHQYAIPCSNCSCDLVCVTEWKQANCNQRPPLLTLCLIDSSHQPINRTSNQFSSHWGRIRKLIRLNVKLNFVIWCKIELQTMSICVRYAYTFTHTSIYNIYTYACKCLYARCANKSWSKCGL